ncbi:MAG: amino acid adenylation domain-containing protein, partial [Burkholderiales bacterium]|nr:amino acid adenylation domain-containing protein [Burkholderiales bacterium]
RTLVLDDDAFGDVSAIARRPDANPLVPGLGARHLAYIIYTSGSTGQPKGVMVEHRNVLRLTINNPFARVSAEDCVAHCANIAFDASTWEVWAPLLNGGRVLMIPHATVLQPERFRQALDEGQVTAMFLTTALFNQYADMLLPILARFRFVLFGGEQADIGPVALVKRFAAPRHFLHVYGPTETTTFASSYEITAIAEGATLLPIGRPIGNTSIYILDRHGQPVPVGVPGEIHIGGAGVARGYLNQPELTAQRFLPDPFSTEPDARMYRTGDLARWSAEGDIEFMGRNDFQVKIRGFRIELGEIETRLGSYAGLRDVAVLMREDQPGDKRLVAYYTLEDGAAVEADALRRHLLQQLPDYMVPAAYMHLDALPLTSNGKLDRRALPVPDGTALARHGYEPPCGDLEETVAKTWQDLLGVERVGRHDHFFELGGHSLLAVQLVSRLRDVLGVELALRDLLSDPTLAEFAALVGQSVQTTLATIDTADRSQPLPLSFAQQRLWFISRLDPAGATAYHMPAALRLHGELDVSALRAALDRIVARHENLRTTFPLVDGTPHQAIAAEDIGFALSERDLSHLHGTEQQQLLQAISADEANAAFDLATGPLIRGQLIYLGGDEHLLLITKHHIVSDGWSIGVLVQEISTLYSAFSRGRPDPLPPLAVQYADYAVWQRHWLQGEVLATQTDFWKSFLGGAPELLELPTDRPRPAVQSYAGDTVSFTLSPALTSGLRALGQRHGATLFMTLLAGWTLLLSRLTGQQDLVIGTPVANRQRSEIESLIGFFVNTLALRVRLADDTSVADLLAQVKANTLQAFEYQDLPFEQVVEALQPVRSMSYSPLFQVMMSLEQSPDSRELQLPGLTIKPQAPELKSAQFDISLVFVDQGESMSGRLQYATDLFDKSTMVRIADCLRVALTDMADDDSLRTSQVALLDERSQDQVLHGFNDTRLAYPKNALIHELFERQVDATPDAIALVAAEQRLSYRELNTRANRLAHRLLALGIEPDARVAISMERGTDMVVSLLAVLKAGGAYVPLDPAYPAERLAHMLNDSAPAALLTQARLAGQLAAAATPVVVVDAADEIASLAHYPDSNPNAAAIGLNSRHLAYVIYTSGSTGLPKGVMLSHTNAVNFITWAHANFTPAQLTQTLFSTSINFDLAVFELYAPLCCGATVHLVADILGAASSSEPLTLINTVPSAVKALLDGGKLPATLNTINVAGEPLRRSLVDRVFSTTDVQIVNNLYGPTETTTYSTWVHMPKEQGFLPHIGQPVANTQVYILDCHGRPVPVGVVGEIYIGGAGVARGYLNRPDLTAERFLKDPFSTAHDARMYRTGDLGRWLADGNIEYRGRNDFQVKIRGFRIELGEIETQLLQCPGVHEAVVMAREDEPGERRLVAYLTLHEGAHVSAGELRSQLERHLAEYMIPSAFVMLPALPLTPNGKLDRFALPAPDGSALASRDYAPPEGAIEEQIAQAWQTLLGAERVGRHDHFFELGGHSLLAVRFLADSQAMFRIELSLRDLFERPVLAQLAEHVAARQFDELMGIDMAAMQDELAGLTESELLAILAAETSSDE